RRAGGALGVELTGAGAGACSRAAGAGEPDGGAVRAEGADRAGDDGWDGGVAALVLARRVARSITSGDRRAPRWAGGGGRGMLVGSASRGGAGQHRWAGWPAGQRKSRL